MPAKGKKVSLNKEKVRLIGRRGGEVGGGGGGKKEAVVLVLEQAREKTSFRLK